MTDQLSASGAALVADEADLFQRTSLLFPDVGFDERHQHQFISNLRRELPTEVLNRWMEEANSETAIQLIKRFASREGDVTDTNEKGLGRISSSSFPRLGGVLSKPSRKRGIDSIPVAASVERVLQASYLAMILILVEGGSIGPQPTSSTDTLWEDWIPQSFRFASNLAEAIDGIVAFVAYWEAVFNQLGLQKAARDLRRPSKGINRAVAGLTMPGATLALVERGVA